MQALFDTNILIDYLLGIEKAKKEIEKYEVCKISIVTWMEVMVGTKSVEEEILTKNFLDMFLVVPLSRRVAELAVQIRKKHKMRLPDAIVWASAKEQESILVTRNTKDFPRSAPDIKIPYKL